MQKRGLWLVLAVVLYCLMAVSPVLAHAELVHAVPEPNAVLSQSPAQVELIFSEPLETELSGIQILDSDGQAIDMGEATVDPTNPERMTVSLPPLPDGLYTVSWQALSQIDGHMEAGIYPFAVGSEAAAGLANAQETTNTNLPIGALIAKWLLLVASALLAGQFPSKYFVWLPALGSSTGQTELSERLSVNWDTLFKIGLTGTLTACVLGMLAQAGQAMGQELAVPWSEATIQILTETRLGVVWLIRLALTLFGFWVVRNRSADRKGYVRFAIGLALLLTISLTSHAATELRPWLPVLADWLHLVGMSFWFGGLAYLISGLVILRNNTEGHLRTDITASMTKRFSWMALPSVGIVGLTGIYSAVLRVGSIAAFLDTEYGQSLLIKQIFVAILLLLAAANFLILSPGIERDSLQGNTNSTSIRHFGKTVLAEVVLACLLLGNVSLLTYLPPAKTLPPKTTLIGNRKVDDVRVALSVSPGLVGSNSYSVRLAPADSLRVVKGVSLSFVPVRVGVPPSDVQLDSQGNGLFTGQGSNISFPERWLVEVTVQRDTFDAVVTFDYNIPSPGSANGKDSSSIPSASILLIVLIGFLIVLNFFIRLR